MIRTSLAFPILCLTLAGCASTNTMGLDPASVAASAAQIEPTVRAACANSTTFRTGISVAADFVPLPGAPLVARGLNGGVAIVCSDPADTAHTLAVQEEAVKNLRARAIARGAVR